MTTDERLDALTLMLCVVFAGLRIALPSHGLNQADIFKDLAHVFVGGLFGAALVSKKKGFWILAGALTLVEIVCAVVKGHA